jgi:D-glycero-alpha-D-manno-heptose-7-phosphate kinase
MIAARDALLAGDLQALGAAMQENTAAQARLHPALVSLKAARVIEIARHHGAIGWKVNGAGGEGGSITLLGGPKAAAQQAMLAAIQRADPFLQVIPIRLSRDGLQVWEQRV